MLPHVDGVTVVRRLREEHDETPVLFLTARDEISDRIAAYTAGGDLTKPFSLETVVDHVRAHSWPRTATTVPEPVEGTR